MLAGTVSRRTPGGSPAPVGCGSACSPRATSSTRRRRSAHVVVGDAAGARVGRRRAVATCSGLFGAAVLGGHARLDVVGRTAVRRRAAPGRAGRAARGRPRPAGARRADQPPRRRGRRLAGRAPGRAARRARRRHPRPVVPRRGLHAHVGGRRRRRRTRTTVATRPTCSRAPSASAVSAADEARRQNLLRKELAWLRRGPPARTSKPRFRIDAANALIADEPPPRDARRAGAVRHRPARQDASTTSRTSTRRRWAAGSLLDDVTWRLGPGRPDRLVGVNGAGKTTLLRLLAGDARADRGRVVARRDGARGVPLAGGRRARSGRCACSRRSRRSPPRSTSGEGREITAAQLVERFGFAGDAAVDAGRRAVRRRAAPAAAAAAADGRAQRAAARRADQRPRHRHADRARGPARRLAGHAGRGLARPLLPRAGLRPRRRAARRRTARATCRAGSRSTSTLRRARVARSSATRPGRAASRAGSTRRSVGRGSDARRAQGARAGGAHLGEAARPTRSACTPTSRRRPPTTSGCSPSTRAARAASTSGPPSRSTVGWSWPSSSAERAPSCRLASRVVAGRLEPDAVAAMSVALEWGPVGAKVLAEQCDVIVVVDVLSFSTSVTVAVRTRWRWCGRTPAGRTRRVLAREIGAVLAGNRVHPRRPDALAGQPARPRDGHPARAAVAERVVDRVRGRRRWRHRVAWRRAVVPVPAQCDCGRAVTRTSTASGSCRPASAGATARCVRPTRTWSAPVPSSTALRARPQRRPDAGSRAGGDRLSRTATAGECPSGSGARRARLRRGRAIASQLDAATSCRGWSKAGSSRLAARARPTPGCARRHAAGPF